MGRKTKFRPVISRIKLNPEQAVLSCPGYDTSATARWAFFFVFGTETIDVCMGRTRGRASHGGGNLYTGWYLEPASAIS